MLCVCPVCLDYFMWFRRFNWDCGPRNEHIPCQGVGRLATWFPFGIGLWKGLLYAFVYWRVFQPVLHYLKIVTKPVQPQNCAPSHRSSIALSWFFKAAWISPRNHHEHHATTSKNCLKSWHSADLFGVRSPYASSVEADVGWGHEFMSKFAKGTNVQTHRWNLLKGRAVGNPSMKTPRWVDLKPYDNHLMNQCLSRSCISNLTYL